jgi:hypothetical protein
LRRTLAHQRLEAETAYEQFRASYPFHPSVLSVFERKWQALPRFQRTRGILRLLALWVARAYREDHRNAYKEPLIGLGTAPIDDPMFRAAMFEQLGTSDLEGPATTDIAGRSDAHALRLDRESAPEIRKARLHQKAATTILFESNGGQLKAEASIGEFKAALGGPDVNLADVDHALEGLITSCYYVTAERNRYPSPDAEHQQDPDGPAGRGPAEGNRRAASQGDRELLPAGTERSRHRSTVLSGPQ